MTRQQGPALTSSALPGHVMAGEREARAVIRCDNEGHTRRVPAVARLSWPDGRFISVAACATCMRWSIHNALHQPGEVRPILITPLHQEAP